MNRMALVKVKTKRYRRPTRKWKSVVHQAFALEGATIVAGPVSVTEKRAIFTFDQTARVGAILVVTGGEQQIIGTDVSVVKGDTLIFDLEFK